MRRGILSDEAIKRMFPEHFPPDFRTHQLIYEDGVDVPKHRLTGIKRSKTAHQHLKTKPRYPLHDLFLHSQAVAPLKPGVKSSVGAYRRAIGDALEREGASFPSAHPSAAFQVSNAPAIRSGGRQAYVQRFDDQYGDVLAIARVDPRAKIFIELAGLSPYEYIPRVKTTSRVHITAGGIRHELLDKAHTFSEAELQNIEGSYRLSEEIARDRMCSRACAITGLERLPDFLHTTNRTRSLPRSLHTSWRVPPPYIETEGRTHACVPTTPLRSRQGPYKQETPTVTLPYPCGER